MRLYKPVYIDRSGQRRTISKWYLDFFTPERVRHRLPLFFDKRACEGVARTIEECISCKVAGLTFETELQRKLDVLPTAILQKLSAFGLLGIQRVEGSKSLTEHIRDWENSFVASGCTKVYLQAIVPRARKVIEGCGFRAISDIDVVKTEAFLVRLRDTGKNRISKATFNHYIRSLWQFGKWLVDVGRAGRNPFSMLKRTTCTKDDQRRPARTLTVDQVRKLISTTANSQDWQGISGRERSLIYLLCNESGIRANEIRQLQIRDFDFDRATVTIRSAVAKNRKEAVLPIKRATAELIRQHVKDKLPSAKVFTVPAKTHSMIALDLERAGIPYKTKDGTAHFHGQRHNFATALSVSAASVKTMQNLLRHSDPRLTLAVYTHGVPEHERAAIENLPNLIEQVAMKTGTDNKNVLPTSCATGLPTSCVLGRFSVDYSGLNTSKAGIAENLDTASKPAILSEKPERARQDSNLQPLGSKPNTLSN